MKMMKNGAKLCKTSFYPPRDQNNTQDIILLLLNAVIAILNLLLNSFVIYVIIKTRQYKNRSVILVLILSCSDVITATVCQPLIVYLLYVKSFYSLSCSLSIIVQYVFYFSPYFSVFTIAFIVYDRYVRITYLHNYDKFMTKKKFIFGLFIVVSATTFQDGIITLATIKEAPKIGGLAVLPINILTLITEVSLYAKTIFKLRRYRDGCKKKNFHTAAENSFTKLAASYLLMIVLCFTPFVVINTIYATYDKTDQSYLNMQYAWLTTQILYCFNSMANAVIFLRVNRKASTLWKRIIRKYQKNGVTEEHYSNAYCVNMEKMMCARSFSVESNNNFALYRTLSTQL